MGEDLFRQSALDKLASPERLDVLMDVTPGKGWVAVTTLSVLFGGLVFWMMFGSIPDRINGRGILLRGGGLRQLRASGEGTLTALSIKLDDVVKVGQQVGVISQIGSSEEIKVAQQRLDQAQREYEASRLEDEATIAGIRAVIAGIEADRKRTQDLRLRAAEKLKRDQDSLAQGLVTRPQVDQDARDVSGYDATMTGQDAQARAQNAQIRSKQQGIRAKEDAVARARSELERVATLTSAYAQIMSTVEGRVVELKKRNGDLVRPGEIVATVEPPATAVEPIIYIDSSGGKRIKPGMEAQVSPMTVRREEYGFMKGKIAEVGEYPVTQDAVMSVTGNDQLTKEFLASGTKIQVNVGLQPDTDTPSGYVWSSSAGPPFKIDSGTQVTVAVVVAKTTPFSYYVTPYVPAMLKSRFGG